MINIFIKTYGCAANQNNSEIMKGLLTNKGMNIVKNIECADVVILNSCIVKLNTENKIKSEIKKISEKYSDKKLIISGCMPEVEKNEIKKIYKTSSLLGTHHTSDIVDAIRKVMNGEIIENIGFRNETKLCLQKVRKNPVINIVQISQGCNENCSFCVTKFAKGKLCSYSKYKIIDDIKESLNECKEIWITSQDTGAYEFNREKLPDLLNDINDIRGKFFVRVGMMNPKNIINILDELIDSYKSEKIYKFLHLPIQSGSDNILKKMRRGYQVSDFINIVNNFRKHIPKLVIWTDIIVGFPGETQKDFEKTYSLIKEIRPDFVNISKFSARPKTDAKKMNDVDEYIKAKRSIKLSELVCQISFERNKERIGNVEEILISSHAKNGLLGRNFSYKAVIIKDKKELLGKFVKVKIIDAKPSYLIGSVVC